MEESPSHLSDLVSLGSTVKEYYTNLSSYPCKWDPEYGFLSTSLPQVFSPTPISSSTLLHTYMAKWLPFATHWQSPFYFSFFPSNSLPSTILGEMAVSAINEGYGLEESEEEKKNREMERVLMGWVGKLLGLNEWFMAKEAHAVVYNTAGDAFLNIALAAKNKKQMEMEHRRIIDKQVGYMTTVSNIAVQRSIKLSNLKLRRIEPVHSSDLVDDFPITAEQLELIFKEDIDNGFVPTLFITTVGSTTSLSIENLKEISSACEKYGVWLHVDAAHLGIYAIVPEYRFILDDIELADSFSTNGHKSLGCGMGTSFSWIKHKDYNKWLWYKSYPNDTCDETAMNLRSSVFMTPPVKNRSLRAMIHLLSMGKNGIIDAFRFHFELADYFRELILEDERFEMLETVNKFSLVLFKLKEWDNTQNEEYLNLVMKSNKIFLVSGEVYKKIFLRMSIGTFTQDKPHIKTAFEHLQACATEYLSLNST
jgi:aromatic-L-amino-acid/L-tryptophan decarboxylase